MRARKRLRLGTEAKAMSFSYCGARSIVLMAVETCSKAILTLCAGHGKSPCFSRCCFSAVFGVDDAVSVSASVNGQDFLECAF